jgi:DNA-binding LacI/PurR family transcriptional regulator
MIELEKSAEPYYRQIKDAIRVRIATGDLKAGAVIPDERTLAAELNISRMTVRRAIVELAREGLLQRVRGKGTFVRQSIQPPKRSRKTTVAIISAVDIAACQPIDLFYYRLLAGVSLGCQQAEILMSYRPPVGSTDAFVASFKSDKALHGIVTVGIDNEPLLQQLRSLSIPVVLLDSVAPAEDAIFDEVTHNGEPAVFDAISHLIRLGHENIGLMQSAGLNSINIQRQYGYERALKTAGLPVRSDLFFPVIIDSEAAYARMRRILNSSNIPTAMFCSGDHLAIGVMAAISDHGWKIPRDISVIGYGNEGYFTSPSLSTIRIPIEQMGIQAIQLLAQRLKHPTAPLRRVVLPTEWMPRGSCDCPRPDKA